MDSMMIANECDNVIIIGNMNLRLVRGTFNSMLAVHNVHNHPQFISRSCLD